MMNNLYEIPKRLKKRNGILGTIELIDGAATLACGGFGFLLAILCGNMIGVLGLVISLAVGYFIFLLKDRYDENYRVKFLRQMDYMKRQKLYYYYRGTK